MAKRRKPKADTPRDVRQKKLFWRTAGVMAFALVALAVAYFLSVKRHDKASGDGDHPHKRAAHGGLIVSLGDDEHYHVEIVLARGGLLHLYTLGKNVTRVVEVESQIVKAQVKSEGAAVATQVELMPIPQSCDSQGKTSRFAGTLPKELWENKLTVTVLRIAIGGVPFAFEFKTPGFTHVGDVHGNHENHENLYRRPGGKYTEADIRANGNQTPPQRYEEFQASHDARLRLGDRICPVSKTKANAKCTWIVGGKTYAFCCPPCIDEFVRRAKEEPQKIKEPEAHVMK